MEEYETIKKGNKVLKIYYDIDTLNTPREWDNMSKLVLNHKRYSFENDLNINFDNFRSWEEIREYLKTEFKAVIVKPVGAYIHSRISIYMGNKNDYWDGGQLGFICVLEEDLIKEYGKNTEETRKKAEKVLNGEFEIYKNYVEGEVFGFELYEKVKVKITKEYEDKTKTKENKEELKLLNSCWGFYGEDGIKQIKEENNF